MRDQIVVAAGQPDFSRHLLEGWHAAEAWCTWSAATEATLLVPLPSRPADEELTVRVILVASPTGGTYSGLRVLANGIELQPCDAGSDGAFAFTARVRDGRPWLLVELHVDTLVTPAASGLSSDQRALGVGLRRVEVDLEALKPATASDRPATDWKTATDLLQPARLDLVIKARYLQTLVTGRDPFDARGSYLKHIERRTGGCEPIDYQGNPSAKAALRDYDLACRALLISMQQHGFDAAHAVPLGKGDRPLNGAHRIACAIAIQQPVAVTQEADEAGTWGMNWFEAQGYPKRERLRLLFDLTRLVPERCSVFVLWAPSVDVWDDVVKEIDGSGYAVAGSVDLAWNESDRPAYESLVYDLYSHGISDFVEGFGHIDRKLGFLRPKPCFVRVGVCMIDPKAGATWEGITPLKAAIRRAHAARVPVDQFVTCHFGDSVAESQHMARTLLLPENLDAACSRPTHQPRPQFRAWLNDYLATLQTLGLDASDCCIVGSAGLEIQGIRLATDIDFTVRGAIRSSRFTEGVTRFESGIDLVTRGYHRSHGAPVYADDDLIDEPGLHVMFRGFKVVAPHLIRDRKAYSRRPKDLLDVELMDAAASRRFATAA